MFLYLLLCSTIACQDLGQWIPSIINYLYWSISTCKGNALELEERFLPCMHHCVNRHAFPGNKFYKACEHGEINDTAWLKFDSPAHKALKSVIFDDKNLLKDFMKLNENIFTTHLEVFHALKIRYLPKSVFNEQEKMHTGMKLAALDHNLNINRNQVKNTCFFCFLNTSVKLHYKMIFNTQRR
ncbi:uncharacterized protein LOC130630704 [Hydractinia symbiolongicarpus]|uniref:uncharacterized protein LOC130630704 n=1 Tax=Hydractinia symbiolongicarpus TaxID=13093 RepID=UPI00254A2994|nr:uncharacterized protein LOC130630704 [Hydractinia symbiolongicarpus]